MKKSEIIKQIIEDAILAERECGTTETADKLRWLFQQLEAAEKLEANGDVQ